ncbi:MAG: hypothetical protein SynsKO_33190 [Synoicihabitans sp.]
MSSFFTEIESSWASKLEISVPWVCRIARSIEYSKPELDAAGLRLTQIAAQEARRELLN